MNLEETLKLHKENHNLMNQIGVLYNTMTLQRHQGLPYNERNKIEQDMILDMIKYTEPPIDEPTLRILYVEHIEKKLEEDMKRFQQHTFLVY